MAAPNLFQFPASNCEELAASWEKMEKLPPDEAKAFADDIDLSRDLPLPKVTLKSS